MLSLILLAEAAAGLGAAPQPIPGSFTVDDDYPADALRAGKDGPVEMDLSIDAKGRVTGCRVTLSAGHETLDRRACDITRATSRYKPARDEAGQPIAAGAFKRFVWTLPGRTPIVAQRSPKSDLFLEVKQLPASVEAVAVVLRMVQAADGSTESCVVAELSGHEAFDKAACRVATPALANQDAVLDADGKPVRHLRMQRIVFTKAGS